METFLLTLIRHGETEENKLEIIQGHLDTHLTLEGRRQATCLGMNLKNEVFTHIFTSDLTRAHDTCQIITNLNETGLFKTTVDSRLRERRLGKLEGKYRSHCWSQVPDPDMETKAQLRQRAVCFFEEMCGKVTCNKSQHNITAKKQHNNLTEPTQHKNITTTTQHNNNTKLQHRTNTTTQPDKTTTHHNAINNIQNVKTSTPNQTNQSSDSYSKGNKSTNIVDGSKNKGQSKRSEYVSQVQGSKGSKTRTSRSCHCIDLITSTLFKTPSYCQCSNDEQPITSPSSVISSTPSTLSSSSALVSSSSLLVPSSSPLVSLSSALVSLSSSALSSSLSSSLLQNSLPNTDTIQPANHHSVILLDDKTSLSSLTFSKPSSSSPPQPLSSSSQQQPLLQPTLHNVSIPGCADLIDDDDDCDDGVDDNDDEVDKDTDKGGNNEKNTTIQNGHGEHELKPTNNNTCTNNTTTTIPKSVKENGIWKAEKNGDYVARVMVVSHGGFLTELITYFFKDLKCEHHKNKQAIHINVPKGMEKDNNIQKDTKQNNNIQMDTKKNSNTQKDTKPNKNTKTNLTDNNTTNSNDSKASSSNVSTTTNNTTTTPPITTSNGIKLGQMSNAGVSRFEVSIKMGKVKRISCICLNNINHLG